MRRWMVWALVAGLIAGCAAPSVPNEPTFDSGLLPTGTSTQAAAQPDVAAVAARLERLRAEWADS